MAQNFQIFSQEVNSTYSANIGRTDSSFKIDLIRKEDLRISSFKVVFVMFTILEFSIDRLTGCFQQLSRRSCFLTNVSGEELNKTIWPLLVLLEILAKPFSTCVCEIAREKRMFFQA